MQLLSNFMANWAGKKRKKTKITESRISTLAAHPAPACPTPPVLPSSWGVLHTPPHLPCKGIRGSLALQPPSLLPIPNITSILATTRSLGRARGRSPGLGLGPPGALLQPRRWSIVPIHAGTSCPGRRDSGCACLAIQFSEIMTKKVRAGAGERGMCPGRKAQSWPSQLG